MPGASTAGSLFALGGRQFRRQLSQVKTFVLSLALAGAALAGLPDPVANARQSFEREKAALARPAVTAYVARLAEIEKAATAAGRLDEALAARQERQRATQEADPGAWLVGQTWQWWHEKLTFRPDGIAENPVWTEGGQTMSWRDVGGGIVILNLVKGRDTNRVALLVFNPDRTSYRGFDFNGKPLSENKRIK